MFVNGVKDFATATHRGGSRRLYDSDGCRERSYPIRTQELGIYQSSPFGDDIAGSDSRSEDDQVLDLLDEPLVDGRKQRGWRTETALTRSDACTRSSSGHKESRGEVSGELCIS